MLLVKMCLWLMLLRMLLVLLMLASRYREPRGGNGIWIRRYFTVLGCFYGTLFGTGYKLRKLRDVI